MLLPKKEGEEREGVPLSFSRVHFPETISNSLIRPRIRAGSAVNQLGSSICLFVSPTDIFFVPFLKLGFRRLQVNSDIFCLFLSDRIVGKV